MATWMDIVGGEKIPQSLLCLFFHRDGLCCYPLWKKAGTFASMCGGWMMVPCGKRLVVWRAGEKALKGLWSSKSIAVARWCRGHLKKIMSDAAADIFSLLLQDPHYVLKKAFKLHPVPLTPYATPFHSVIPPSSPKDSTKSHPLRNMLLTWF